MSKYLVGTYEDKNGFFAIRGDIDGERKEEFIETEQFIGLHVEKEEFLLPISLVSEILMLTPITYVPRAPNYIEGVINLRGIIIPTINLRKIAGNPKGKTTQDTRIIVVKFQEMLFGLIVDGITYVQSLTPNEIDQQALPLKNSTVDVITRISKKEEAIRGILDIGKIIELASGDKLNITNPEGELAV